ncbi:phosphopantetheine-binding protein [Aestuariivirga litoralis]|uniref:phosphopantetheine-binding protein n=1 Tax=Aestuariivirga litoralis TaxID=2650924 RepID=UPI001FEE3804|nr:phosphopantetheine-binding protein [Aestuariivirga litoralis]
MNVRAEIETLVKSILASSGCKVEVTPERGLAELGLTSMDMMNLMLGVEAKFNMMIPAEFLTPEHFHSVASVEKMISALSSKQKLAAVA